jgi:hypothetical protein
MMIPIMIVMILTMMILTMIPRENIFFNFDNTDLCEN